MSASCAFLVALWGSRAIGSSCFFARPAGRPDRYRVTPAYQLGEVLPHHLWPFRMRSTASPPFTSCSRNKGVSLAIV